MCFCEIDQEILDVVVAQIAGVNRMMELLEQIVEKKLQFDKHVATVHVMQCQSSTKNLSLLE